MEELNKILQQENTNVQQENLIQHEIQKMILQAMQKLFPPNYNFIELNDIYESNTQTTDKTYNLVEYFIRLISSNFISKQHYEALEQQTQKQQAMIRQHIKNLNGIKIYLEDLEAHKTDQFKPEYHKQQILQLVHQNFILQNKIDILSKQKIKMIKKNSELQNQIKIQQLSIQESILRNTDDMPRKLKQFSVNSKHYEAIEEFNKGKCF